LYLRVAFQTYFFIGDEVCFTAWDAALRRTFNEQMIARGMSQEEFSFIELSIQFRRQIDMDVYTRQTAQESPGKIYASKYLLVAELVWV
jgi:hypothetical protein